MTDPIPDAPAPDVVRGATRRIWLRTLLPYLCTALSAVLISLGLQQILFAPPAPPTFVPITLPSVVAPMPAPTIVITPAPTPPALAESIARQELADLRVEVDHLWSVVYLGRAISQVADAEMALRMNDRLNVDQSLIAVDDALALAYARADVPAKDPIREIRRQLGDIRDDLYLRPEGMDTRFSRLRQSMLALVEARQP